MTQAVINVGAVPNDPNADPVRTAFQKCNANFSDIYNTIMVGLPDLDPFPSASPALNSTTDFVPTWNTLGQIWEKVSYSSLKLHNPDFVNIQDYGGVGNGVTLNDVPWTLAVAALGSRGGTIYFPAGKYAFSGVQSLNYPAANGIYDVTLMGAGTGSSILFWNASDGVHVNMNGGVFNNQSFHAQNLSFTTGSAPAAGFTAVKFIQGGSSNGSYSTPSELTRVTFRADSAIIDSTLGWNVDFDCSGVSNVNVVGCMLEGPATAAGIGIVYGGLSATQICVVLNLIGTTINNKAIGINFPNPWVQGITISSGSNISFCTTCINVPFHQTSSGTLAASPFNPINIQANPTVTVTHTAHGLAQFDAVKFAGASTVHNVNMNGTWFVSSVINANSYQVVAYGQTSNATGAGGGTPTFSYSNLVNGAQVAQLSISNSQFAPNGVGIATDQGAPIALLTINGTLFDSGQPGASGISATLGNFTIDGNTFELPGTGIQVFAQLPIASGSIDGNVFGGCASGITLQASATNVGIGPNQFVGCTVNVTNGAAAGNNNFATWRSNTPSYVAWIGNDSAVAGVSNLLLYGGDNTNADTTSTLLSFASPNITLCGSITRADTGSVKGIKYNGTVLNITGGSVVSNLTGSVSANFQGNFGNLHNVAGDHGIAVFGGASTANDTSTIMVDFLDPSLNLCGQIIRNDTGAARGVKYVGNGCDLFGSIASSRIQGSVSAAFQFNVGNMHGSAGDNGIAVFAGSTGVVDSTTTCIRFNDPNGVSCGSITRDDNGINPGIKFQGKGLDIFNGISQVRIEGGIGGNFYINCGNFNANAGDNGMQLFSGSNNATDATTICLQFKDPAGDVCGNITRNDSAGVRHVAYNVSSDIRLKPNTRVSDRGLADLRQLQVIDYGPEFETQGFAAQQVRPIYPEATRVGGDDPATDPWMMDYGRITPLLVRAIQQLSDRVDELSKKLA